jgi:3-hydroxyacyl-[acyl-carrier-protein] dehydratase
MRLEYFQLVDRILDLDLDRYIIRTETTVPKISTIFEGHFPGYPLMPGVLLIEIMAQSSGWLIVAAKKFTRMPFLAAVKEAKLRSFVSPGARLEVTSTLLHDGSGFARTKNDIRSDGKLICNAEITFRVVEFPNTDFLRHLKEAAVAVALPMEIPSHG